MALSVQNRGFQVKCAVGRGAHRPFCSGGAPVVRDVQTFHGDGRVSPERDGLVTVVATAGHGGRHGFVTRQF
ncbi:hypothetical protein ACFEO6_005028 [Salmonella enterica]